MKYFFESQLGPKRYCLADGSLLCKDVPIARTGTQLYSADDLPNLKPNAAGEIVVTRSPEQVFNPATLASFEGMSVTVLHPEDADGNTVLVNTENWRELAHGHLQNVRRGDGAQADLMLADLIIKDAAAIQLIEDGLRQVSCGYNAEYEQTAPGRAEQVEITGNHVALVPKGRAGNRCAIGDRDTMPQPKKKNWLQKLRFAANTGDADTINELLDDAPASVTGDEGDLPQGVNLNINLPPQQPLPDKGPEMGGVTGDSNSEIVVLLKALLEKLEGGQPTGDEDDDKEKDTTADSDDDEKEAPVTADAAYRAEVIKPGVDISRKIKPTEFKREVLASADKALVRQVVGDADISKLPKSAIDVAFNAASEIAKTRNTSAVTGDSARTPATNNIAEQNRLNAEFWAKRKG